MSWFTPSVAACSMRRKLLLHEKLLNRCAQSRNDKSLRDARHAIAERAERAGSSKGFHRPPSMG